MTQPFGPDADFTPLPDDPDAEVIERMIDARGGDWLLTADGEYQAAAVKAFDRERDKERYFVAVEWPARLNHSDELRTVRMMMAPEDAIGLAEVIRHSATWLLDRQATTDAPGTGKGTLPPGPWSVEDRR